MFLCSLIPQIFSDTYNVSNTVISNACRKSSAFSTFQSLLLHFFLLYFCFIIFLSYWLIFNLIACSLTFLLFLTFFPRIRNIHTEACTTHKGTCLWKVDISMMPAVKSRNKILPTPSEVHLLPLPFTSLPPMGNHLSWPPQAQIS